MAWTISNKLYENWLCSQEQEGVSLEGICSDGEQSQPLNTTPMPDQYYWPDKTTEHSRLSRFGMTCEPLTADHGAALLTWYREGFHVRTLALQEQGQDLTENEVAFGRSSIESLGKYDRVSHTLKTAQCSLVEDWIESSVILPRWGTMRNGVLFPQQIAALHTKEKESGFWPTPQTRGFTNDGDLIALGKMSTNYQEMSGMAYRAADKKKQKYWPTPRSCSAMAATITLESAWDMKRFPNLETMVGRKLWPTPTAHNAKETNAPSEAKRNTPTLAHQPGGQLNPPWVEWLMGWPIGWTDLKPLETDKFHEWQQQHGAS